MSDHSVLALTCKAFFYCYMQFLQRWIKLISAQTTANLNRNCWILISADRSKENLKWNQVYDASVSNICKTRHLEDKNKNGGTTGSINHQEIEVGC